MDFASKSNIAIASLSIAAIVLVADAGRNFHLPLSGAVSEKSTERHEFRELDPLKL